MAIATGLLALAVIACPGSEPRTAHPDTSMSLSELNHRNAGELAIRDLIMRLALIADEGELDEAMQLLSDDVVWEIPERPEPLQGRAAILAHKRERRASGTSGPGSQTRHVVQTSSVVLDGDRAQAISVFQFHRSIDERPELLIKGEYHDEFQRTAAGWRLSRRRVVSGR